MKFRLATSLFDDVSRAREQEWRVALMDLNADADGEEPTLTLARRADGGSEVTISGTPDSDGVAEFSRDVLRRQFRDYEHVIKQISGAGAFGARQYETLDYAKKLVHDEAGEVIQETLAPFVSLDHKQARRLFTLVFLISSELPEVMVRRHRRDA